MSHSKAMRLAGAAALTVAGGWLATGCTSLSPMRAAPEPTSLLGARAVTLSTASGDTVRGWFATGRAGAGSVLLLHGLGASRRRMEPRAHFLRAAGYSVLLIDFRGHGESGPGRTTYGALESFDALAAVNFLRASRPGEPIAAIGVSMGGAAALLGPKPLPVDALILESVYATIDAAVRDRLQSWVGALGRRIARVYVDAVLPRLGVSAAELRPIDRIAHTAAPIFLLAGAADRYTPIEESRALFARARDPKELWVVEGAGHVDLHAHAPAEYERRVLAFLARHLRPPAIIRAGDGPKYAARPTAEGQGAVRR